jgi:hypothetical protein
VVTERRGGGDAGVRNCRVTLCCLGCKVVSSLYQGGIGGKAGGVLLCLDHATAIDGLMIWGVVFEVM